MGFELLKPIKHCPLHDLSTPTTTPTNRTCQSLPINSRAMRNKNRQRKRKYRPIKGIILSHSKIPNKSSILHRILFGSVQCGTFDTCCWCFCYLLLSTPNSFISMECQDIIADINKLLEEIQQAIALNNKQTSAAKKEDEVAHIKSKIERTKKLIKTLRVEIRDLSRDMQQAENGKASKLEERVLQMEVDLSFHSTGGIQGILFSCI